MKKAFTMLELIFVIIVIGIIAAVVIPRTGSNKLNEAALQVLSHIRYTQHLAIVDDRYDANDALWWQERWQIRFPRTTIAGERIYYYEIFSDKNHQGNSDASEEAKDPLTGNNIGDGVTTVGALPENSIVNLTKKYGITGITGTCIANGGIDVASTAGPYRTIAFDHIGRPYYDVYTGLYSNLIPSNNGCTIILTSPEGIATVKVEGETGYAHIL